MDSDKLNDEVINNLNKAQNNINSNDESTMDTYNESINSPATSSRIRSRSNSVSSNTSNRNIWKVNVTKKKVKKIIQNNNSNNIVNLLNKRTQACNSRIDNLEKGIKKLIDLSMNSNLPINNTSIDQDLKPKIIINSNVLIKPKANQCPIVNMDTTEKESNDLIHYNKDETIANNNSDSLIKNNLGHEIGSNVTATGHETWRSVTALTNPNSRRRLRKIPMNPEDPNDNRFALLAEDVSADDDSIEEFPAINLKREKISYDVSNVNKKIVNKSVSTEKVDDSLIINDLNKDKINNNSGSSTSSGLGRPGVTVENVNKVKSSKKPPIMVYNLNHKGLRQNLNELGTTNYTILPGANGNKSRINALDNATHDNIIKLLEKSNVNFFNFTEKGDKGINLIIKKVASDFTAEDLMVGFKDLKLEAGIEKIIPLSYKFNKYINHFILKLKPGVSVSAFTNVEFLLNSRVEIQRFNRTDIVQCYRCQRPGHVAPNCRMDPRCVKCSLTHEPNNCSITSDSPKELLKCVLCKGNGHTSSYRGCPVMKKLIDEKIKRKKIYNVEKQTFI